MKTCSVCREKKNFSEFGSNAAAKDKLQCRCRACRKIESSVYYSNNKDKVNDYAKKWAQANPETVADTKRRWFQRNPLQAAMSVKKWENANPEKVAARHQRWKRENPEKVSLINRVASSNRRARKRIAGGKLSPDIATRLLASQQGLCACCGAELKGKYHLDHIMPIALGGSNSDDNVQLLLPRCNQRKYAKHPAVYAQECKNRIINALV